MGLFSKLSYAEAHHAAALWVDNSNIARCRVVPLQRLQEPGFRVQLTHAIQGMPAMYDVALESPVGAVTLRPDDADDPTLYRINAWMGDAVAFFGDMRLDDDGATAWDHCPRSFLRRQLQKLLEDHRVVPTLGFELEFQLLDPKTDAPVDDSLYCSVAAIYSGKSWEILRQIVSYLEYTLKIPVKQYHPESASGQFEISIGTFGIDDADKSDAEASVTSSSGGSGMEKVSKWSSVFGGASLQRKESVAETQAIPKEQKEQWVANAIAAVDKLVLARQAVHGIAARNGLRATFVPKLRPNEAANAAHVHLGFIDVKHPRDARNLFESDVERASSFLAGVLHHLPAMCMLLSPTMNSYDRLQPKCWAGAYQCYGYENREAALRLLGPPSARDDMSAVDHFEIKTIDATANPYLALGAILAAAMEGAKAKLKLPAPCAVDPSTTPDAYSRLPTSLGDAIKLFQESQESVWANVLSPSYCELLVKLRSAELGYYSELSDEERVRQLARRY
ncbi:hypothetical protein ATCC90586_005033 [Pythium insidiosum]|nr:hypothetical protein ATCC90586_005033 [Pythium insidiosum]